MRSIVSLPWLKESLRRLPIELNVLLGLLVIIGGIWLFIELADEVHEGETQKFDEWILRQVRDPADPTKLRGPPWMAEVARDLTALGGYAVLILVNVAVCGFLAILGKRVALWSILMAVPGGFVISMVLKSLFERPRPSVVEHLSYVSSSSFPSGHSMMAAVVYLTMGALLSRFIAGRAVRLYCLGSAILITALVGISRVLMGVHYPSDVLGGWAAGLVWATICWLIARRWQVHHPRESVEAKIRVQDGGRV